MRLLDRYIAREVVSHAHPRPRRLHICFFRAAAGPPDGSGRAPLRKLWSVTLLFLCTIPPVLAFTLPIGVLVGVLIGLGRLSADSEIVALHASGISLRRLLLPIGVVAVVATGATLLNTFWLSPLALRTAAGLEAAAYFIPGAVCSPAPRVR